MKSLNQRYKKGWFKESYRHSLASKGIKTSKKYRAMHMSTLDFLRSKGANIFIVGGKVRDDLSGHSSKDIDYMITGIPQERLTELLRKRGSVSTDKNLGVIKFNDALLFHQREPDNIVLPRKEISTGVGHKEFHLEYDPNLPIEEDLRRRDFTINAMARDAITGELIDPFGGKEDLEHKKIKIIQENAFEEDPLRMVRGAQFASRFDADIDSETREKMIKSKDLIKTVTQERIAEELRKGFGGKNPEKMYDALFDTGVFQEMIPELKDIEDFKQNKYHTYNLDKHTREVVNELGKLSAGEDKNERFKKGMAALLHDIGKPLSLSETEKGRQFIGHALESEKIANNVVNRLKLSNEEKQDIKFLVKNHDALMYDDISDRKIRKLLSDFGEKKVRDLIQFRKADRLAQGRGRDIVDIHINNLNQKIDRNIPLTFSKQQLAIQPKELIQKYHVSSGPEIGFIQDQMHKAVLTNPKLNTEKSLRQFIPGRYRR